ncbi:1-acyl-sn-glycerol-3-phosphate acyltransferase [Sandaracinobacter neustonicus]|uniref:1-acyl-sn-glycerol-3-phosphate acyltransferase n=1 Tax=Sandaracinobacter neustonicus TaxID=1715348 RepID=A0A501XDD4_9SPHN|nr:lysophospholipid acyltransferase family protein [Sandaracinobacter neustonicus]TPE58600.1 1-acyl-sn-glycerol-3-phosphate acyltransferase [Sandaracinobacter neustonicus]
MAFIRSILFHIIFYPISALIATSIMLAAPLSAEAVRRGAHIWAAWYVGCCRIILGIRLQVRGRIPNESVIAASKHTSAYETLLTLYLFHHPAVVMKAELRKIPVWGWVAARHGSIFVERNKAGSALKSMIRQARARSAEGRPVFIFPEGTRVPQGSAPPLKAGLFGIYSGLKVPIVPIAHDAGKLWTRSFVKHPGTITISFLPDIPANLPREEMEARVHAAINQDPLTAEVRA